MSSVNFLDFSAIYNVVIAPDGTVNACGREKCSELIQACQKFRPMAENFYGNPKTGFMEVDAIRGLYKDAVTKYSMLMKK